ncbi:hypothetical protein K933_01027 [Candidatus Halobonum tyrrellensis G22]|uniref:Uncharacterized protein n=1 Tax=Candidatus Halobonum tyrrellensis G22 TaxID=1324957 RepID=V4HH66_9EURY|nr:hypothetical protein K933_01027 [Candidatus Halobonum tyrrellensis G22]
MERGVGLVALLGALFGLCVWYGTLGTDPASWVFPRTAQVFPGPERYIGRRVVLAGEVVSVDPVVVSLAGTDPPVRVLLDGVDRPVAAGVRIRAFGVLESEGTLRTLGVVTTRPGGFVYAATASIVGGLVVIGRLLRDWRVDLGGWGLEPRASPPSLRALAGAGEDGAGTGEAGDDRDA